MRDAGLLGRVRDAFGGRKPSNGRTLAMLDGLRGLAVLLVVLGHMERGGLVVLPHVTMLYAGSSGVQLFFVLSSFLLTSVFFASSDEALRRPSTWAAYFARRVLRIYPLYTLVLLVGTSRTDLSQALFGPHEVSVVDHLLLRQGYKIMWTIPVEMKFYFFLPLLVVASVFVLGRRGPAMAAFAVGASAAAQWACPMVVGAPTSIELLPSLPFFLAGFGAAVLHHAFPSRSYASRVVLEAVGWAALVWWFCDIVLGVLPLWLLAAQSPLGRGVTWALVVLATVDAGLLLSRLFSLAPLRYAGILSFSVYLLHMPIVEGVRRVPGWSDAAKASAIFAAVFGVCTLSYLFVEYPFLELGRRLSRRRRPAASAS